MAVAHDAVAESHSGATGSVSEASFNWSHIPTGTPRGIVVFTFGQTSADDATAVTYGGVAMAAVSGGRAVDTTDEAGDCKAWFLGASIPTGTQTVVVTRNNNANILYAVSLSVTAAADTQISGTPVLLENDGALTEQSVDTGGTTALRYAAANWGASSVPALGVSTTTLTATASIDFGVRVIRVAVETTAGSGSRPVGFDQAGPDDRAAVHLAVAEASGGTQSLTGTLFTKAPTFPTGVVSQAGGTQTLTGTLFTKAPTVPTGTVTASGATQRTHYDSDALNNVTSGTSVAFTPAANSILLCYTLGRLDVGVPTPTVTGHGLTWEIVAQAQSGPNRVGWLFGAWVGASPSNGTVTVDYGVNIGMAFSIVGEAGTATGALNSVIRTVGLAASDDVRSSFAIHQQAFVHPTNDALGFWYIGQDVTATVGTGWTELGQASAGSVTVLSQGRVGEGLVMDASWNQACHIGSIIACEVRAAGSPAFGPVRNVKWLTRGQGTAESTITTASITPTAEALVCVLVSSGRSTGPQTPTSVVGNGITYTLAGSVDFDTVATPLWRFSVWTGSAVAPTAGTVVVTFPGNQSEGRRWAICEVEDVTSVVQIASAAVDAATSINATLGTFDHSNNPAFGLLASAINQTWPTPGSGFQQITDPLDPAQPASDRIWGIWRGSNDTSVDMTYPSASDAAFIALELEAVVVIDSASQTPNATTSNDGWDTAPLAGQAIHTYIATDDTDYITVTVP